MVRLWLPVPIVSEVVDVPTRLAATFAAAAAEAADWIADVAEVFAEVAEPVADVAAALALEDAAVADEAADDALPDAAVADAAAAAAEAAAGADIVCTLIATAQSPAARSLDQAAEVLAMAHR